MPSRTKCSGQNPPICQTDNSTPPRQNCRRKKVFALKRKVRLKRRNRREGAKPAWISVLHHSGDALICKPSLTANFSSQHGLSSNTQKQNIVKPNSTTEQQKPPMEPLKKDFVPPTSLKINHARLCRKKSTTKLENIQV